MRSTLTPKLGLAALLLLPACADESPGPAALDTPTAPGGSIQAAWGPAEPAFNLEAILRRTDDGDGFGLVKFRQPNDEEFVVYLDTWVRDLVPNTAYALQRAVDLSPPNGQCDGESGWLTLGKGLVPQAIVTDEEGTGREQLFRAVPPTSGVGFDIQFRIVDDATKSVVALQSECYQYTISP